jgi:cephalosporin hydroxylase
VETGTWTGGSALCYAMLFDLLGHGEEVTVDVEPRPNRPVHPRIRYLTGSSVDPDVVAQVQKVVGNSRALVVLDSNHQADHVYQEMMAYNGCVEVGDYLVVEDTNVNGHPVWPEFGPGPMEAIDKFLSQRDDFVIDRRCERFLMTQYPRGYLRRVTTWCDPTATRQVPAPSPP